MKLAAKHFERWIASASGRVAAPVLVGAFSLCFAVRYGLDGAAHQGLAVLVFLPAVVLAAFAGGPRMGGVAAILALFAERIFFSASFPALLAFAAVAALDIALAAALRRAIFDAREQRLGAEAAERRRGEAARQLQHRFGNDLQTIAALLAIQARAEAEADAKRALDAAAQRVAVIALVRRSEADDETDAQLDEPFVREAAAERLADAGLSSKIALDVRAAPTRLPRDTLLPVALILSEAIGSAVQHAPADPAGARLTITVERAGSLIRIVVAGEGFNPQAGFDAASRPAGAQVIQAFARQIDGSVKLGGGAIAELTFPLRS